MILLLTVPCQDKKPLNYGTVQKNIATEGLSGKVGNFVFRLRKSDDKIFVSRIPVGSEEEPSEARKAVQRKFQRGIAYGKSAIADPATKALYAAKATEGRSAFNVAVADYFNAPQIEKIEMGNHSGAIGSTITITLTSFVWYFDCTDLTAFLQPVRSFSFSYI